jgi:hypothetical protein
MFRPVRRALAISLPPLAAVLAAVLAGPPLPASAGTVQPAGARVFPELESRSVRMPHGVRLAVDVWLPAGTTAGARLPTVLQTDRCPPRCCSARATGSGSPSQPPIPARSSCSRRTAGPAT